MAKRKKGEQENSPFKMVLYTIAVLGLIGCLVFFVYADKRAELAYEEQVRIISEGETEYVMTERKPETESETETETEAPPATEAQQTETPAAATEQQTEATSDTSAVETNAQGVAIDKAMPIMVLNGTRKEGVAGYWSTQLMALGYTNVSPVNYNGRIEEETVIYAEDTKRAEQLLLTFPNAVIRQGSITSGIEVSAGGTIPQEQEVYIVVGTNDARSS